MSPGSPRSCQRARLSADRIGAGTSTVSSRPDWEPTPRRPSPERPGSFRRRKTDFEFYPIRQAFATQGEGSSGSQSMFALILELSDFFWIFVIVAVAVAVFSI